MKKNGEIKLLLGALAATAIAVAIINRNKAKSFINYNNLTIDNFVNRLQEFDLSPTKDASNLFYELIEFGFSPQSAFDVVQKEATEAGEYFN